MAFDPGLTTGWATFIDAKLWAAGTCAKNFFDDLPELEILPAIIVVEKPAIWGRRSNPDSILELALWAGTIRGAMLERCAHRADSEYVPPVRWKGAVPKEITNERTLEQLEAGEVELMPRRPRAKDFDHNMLDAVGIGLWQLQRERQR